MVGRDREAKARIEDCYNQFPDIARPSILTMKISCPNPVCNQHLSGPKTLIGRRISCPACGHLFIWTDCFHSGDSFVIYDLETTGLELSSTRN